MIKRQMKTHTQAPVGAYRRMTNMLRDRTGGVAAVFAIVSPVLIGAMGLGAEVGYWYLSERKLQNAADVAAHAAALRRNKGDNQAQLEPLAEYVVGQADVNMTQTAVAVNIPPTAGAYVEDGNAVEVQLNQTVPRLFSAIYDNTPLQLSARAVATADAGGRGCVLALSETQAGAITITGSNSINLMQCDFISNGAGASFEMQGNGSVANANCVQAAGTATTTANLTTTCATLRENAGITPDPFAAKTEPVLTGACQDGDIGKPNQSNSITPSEAHTSGLSSIRFCNGLSLKGTVSLNPGLYMIEGGDFQINSNATINGTGVVFYMASDVEITFNGTAAINLTAPTSGTYNGMLFFGSRSATSISHRINGNSSTALNGAIYTPVSHIDWLGNNSTGFTSCTQVVTDTITFSGNSSIMMHCLFPPAEAIDIAGTFRIVE